MENIKKVIQTIYFLSRTSDQQIGGGLIRFAQAKYFRECGYRVIMVVPEYGHDSGPISNDEIRIPIRLPLRLGLLLEHIGIVDDYLFEWANRVIAKLKPLVCQHDIVFASSGGELSMLRIASTLRKAASCRYVANLHDPIVYTSVNGAWVGRKTHVSRDRWERRYLENANLIVTSTKSYAESLGRKYPKLGPRIQHMYFGYTSKLTVPNKKFGDRLAIAYGGIFQRTQSPEKLAEVATGMPDVDVIFIGNHSNYRPLDCYRKDVKLIASMPQADYNNYLSGKVDVGFVSLAEEIYGHCVPSKIYEYINAGIPILGALPRGEASDIINDSGFGIATKFSDTLGLKNAITEMKNRQRLEYFRTNILRERNAWHLDVRMDSVRNLMVGRHVQCSKITKILTSRNKDTG